MNDPAGKLSADAWDLDTDVVMLNHGSFGACPRVLLESQTRLRRRLEAAPIRFLMREMEPLLEASRQALGGFLGAQADDLAFVRNATEGVNGVLRSLRLEPGDELLTTDHAYNACRNAMEFVAQRCGGRVVVAGIGLPVESAEQVVEAICRRVTERTRLALVDHVTSATAIVFPIRRIVEELNTLGVDTLVDGAHAPGMLPLDLGRIAAAYYAGNCHKWMCCPKGVGFLHVRADRREDTRPAVISHGLNTRRQGRSRFHDEFDWTGTDDPTPRLLVDEAIRFLDSLDGDGVGGLMRRNRALAIEAAGMLRERFRSAPTCPDAMLGSMATVRLPDDPRPMLGWRHPLQDELFERFAIEAPVFHWPSAPDLHLRVSAQAYNNMSQYEFLADSLASLL